MAVHNNRKLLQYFRLNDPYRFIGLLVIFLVIFVPLLIDAPDIIYPELKAQIIGAKSSKGFSLYTGIIDSTAPLTGWVYAFADFLFGSSLTAWRILALIVLFILTALIAIIFIARRAFPDTSFIPPLVFLVLVSFSFDTIFLSGNLLASLFLLIAISSLFREIESREPGFEMVQRIGLCLGIATLFDFSFIVYVLGVLIIQLLFTRASGRKLILLVVSFLIPHLLLIAIYSINSAFDHLWQFYYLPNLSFAKTSAVSLKSTLLIAAVPALFFLASLVTLNRESRFTKYQSQLVQAMFFITIFSVLQALYSADLRPQSFLPMMIGFAFFISHFFSIIIRRRFAELIFWAFLIGTVTVSYLHRYNTINEAAYANLYVPDANTTADLRGKKVLTISGDLSLYRTNEMATPFLNWNLCQDVFDHPEYYDNIILVSEGFKKDLPDEIIDPQDRLKPFLERIPALRTQYVKSAFGYQKKKVSN